MIINNEYFAKINISVIKSNNLLFFLKKKIRTITV